MSSGPTRAVVRGIVGVVGSPVQVLVAYAVADDDLWEELESHLQVLVRQGAIETWSNRPVGAGEDWRKAVEPHLASASVIVLLLSAGFLAGGHGHDDAGDRMKSAKARVLPVRLRPCASGALPFEHLRALPASGEAVTTSADRDAAWAEVAAEIRAIVAGAAEVAPGPAPNPRVDERPVPGPPRSLDDLGDLLALALRAEASGKPRAKPKAR